LNPSASRQPSASPTDGPSETPTISIAPSTSASPIAAVLLTANAVEVTLQGVSGQMDVANTEFFEEETKLFLQEKIHQAAGVLEIEIQSITVTSQAVVGARRALDITKEMLRRGVQQQGSPSLVITVLAVASAILDRDEHFDLSLFLGIVFENAENQRELRNRLEQLDSFSQAVFAQDPESEGNATETAAMGPTITGAMFGATASVVGCGMIWMWIQKRRFINSETSEDARRKSSIPATFSQSDADDDPCPTSRPFVVDPNTFETMEKPKCDPCNLGNVEQWRSTSARSVEENIIREGRIAQLRYEPALIRTESNIEVPETPVTAFTMIGTTFTSTKAGTHAERDTPLVSHIGVEMPLKEDEGSGCVLMGSPKEHLRSAGDGTNRDDNSRRKKKSRFDFDFRSPFRRGKQADNGTVKFNAAAAADDDDDDDDVYDNDFDVSSVSGGFLAALTNHIGNPSSNKGETEACQPLSEDPVKVPSTIGGPDALPSLANSIKSRDATVTIVDEIAYLYATNHGEIREPSNLSRPFFSGADFPVPSADDFIECVTNRKTTNTPIPCRWTPAVARSGKLNRPSCYLSDDSDIEENES
jgi:hypothetical protein